MPTISSFYGILIRMFFKTITPRHTSTPDMARSKPRSTSARSMSFRANSRAGLLSLVQERAMIHKEELLEDWPLCRENSPPGKIEPLP